MVTVSKVLYVLSHWLIGLGFSLIHIFHISRLYENQSKFSHLSSLERELQLTPKEAFYYQFYKRLIEANTFENGIRQLVFDNLTEFNEGMTTNSLRKFHILPEVITGFLYRNFIDLTTTLNIPTVNCYYVEPDEESKIDDPKVFINCEGLGEPIFFYLAIIWSLSAVTVFLLYMYGYFLHRNIIAGCAVIVYYFCVHETATNIHRAPMMRHNFAMPFIVWQTFYLNLYVDRHKSVKDPTVHQRNYAMIISMIIFTTLANVFWEMSAHVFLAQTMAVFILLQCTDKSGIPYIATGLALDYAISQIFSNWMSYCLMYGNMKFITSGTMSVNLALVVYIVRIKLLRLPIDDENPNFSSPVRRLLTVTFFFISTAWFVQDVMDRLFSHSFAVETTSSYHMDVILTMLHLKLPSFYTLLTYYRETVQELISISTLRVYCVVFVFKNLSVYIAIKFYDMLHQKNEAAHEMNERAKNYVIEDFLETNRITMKDLSNPKTEKRIQKDLELLEQCNFDYELYKQEKKSLKTDTKIEKENFLNDIKMLKTQIQKGEKAQAKEQSDLKEDEEPAEKKEFDDLPDSPIRRRETKEEKKDEEPAAAAGDKEKVNEEPKASKKRERKSRKVPKLLTESPFYIQPFYTFAILQTFAIFFVALKYVATPFLCLITATLPSRSWFHKTSSVYWVFYLFLVLCTFNYPGYKNLRGQLQHKSEFRNPELESLIHWIDKTEPNAVFGAPIEVAAHILLTTKRPIVNHPLIEYQDMIDRTRSLYSIFSKRLSTDIYNQLVKLRVQYVVISYESCFVGSKDGLRLIDIFDYLEPENYDKKAFCVSLFQKHNPTFLKVFENVKYIVIQIFSQSIQLELKKKSVLEFHM